MISFDSLTVLNLDKAASLIGKPEYLAEKVLKCCCTKSVVGTNIATCFPSCTALNAARTAISVLP
ncbi:unannotated protein [freshwater metagenome]|uniref:Unannotated protein n=1 Tax=freshwater metagenome TaxID=449393 RepID=A0A6J6S0D7_9ZZZZ